MTTWWTCTCTMLNDHRAKVCEKCGTPRPQAAEPATPGPSLTCAWTTDGRRCLMAGVFAATMGTPEKPSRWLCEWHSAAGLTAADRDNFDEYERWILGYLDAGYCMQFTHRRASTLWGAVRGAEYPSGLPTPCALGSCPHRPEFHLERLPVSDLEAREHLALLQRVLARSPLAVPQCGISEAS